MTQTICEPSRDIPVIARTEVLVVGSGPGGLAAAIASARQGRETMLVERFGCFGGTITQACVESIAWYRHPQTVEAGGIGMEFERRAVEMNAAWPEVQSSSYALDTEMFKYVADRMVLESGIRPLLHASFVQPVMDGDCIVGAVIESKSGRQALLAQRVIDASGDADVAARAGAPYTKAPAQDLMGVSVSFSCSGVNKQRFMDYVQANPGRYGHWAARTSGKEDHLFSPYIQEPFDRAKQAGEIPEDVEIAGTWSNISSAGEATYINVIYMLGYDCTDVWELTRGEIQGRQQALWAVQAMQKHLPGFEQARLRSFSTSLGTRESRKILGRFGHLTGDHVRNQARFDDTIGIFPEFLDGQGMVILPTTGRYFQVPYGIIVPQKVENLLVAGRAVAGDQTAHAAVRAMMCCALTGQAAGVAAALSLSRKKTCAQLDVGLVQKALQADGVRLH